MPKTTQTKRPAPLRDRTIALLAARGAYVRALRRALQAAEHLSLTAVECRTVPRAAALREMATEQSAALALLLDAAE